MTLVQIIFPPDQRTLWQKN